MINDDFPHRGELWWVQFPSEDKKRPAVIVSPDVRNSEGENVIIAGCSSRRTDKIYDDEVMLKGLGLKHSTKVQFDYLYTIKQALLSERIACLYDHQLECLDESLQIALGVI